MTVQIVSLRRHRVDAAPPPGTVAQQCSDLSQDLAVKLRAVYSGWSHLGALEFYELTQAELIGRLDALCRGLQPRYAQRTLATKSGAWFDGLEKAQSGLATVPLLAQFYRQLHPDATRLAGLIEKLVGSNKWPPDLESLMTNAATALHDFAEARPLKGHMENLEGQLKRERSGADTGAVEGGVADALETRLERARGVLAALEG